MIIIKVGATDSTNLHLKRMLAETELEDLTVLVTDAQLKGRGQAGAQWISEPGKNLTFSVLKYFDALEASRGFLISQAVSLALIDAFGRFGIPDLSIKWPNDIMSGHKKICGILIENTIKGNSIVQAVIGIGININQASFSGLPHAASFSQITGTEYDLDSVLDVVLNSLRDGLVRLSDTDEEVPKMYDSNLFLKDREAEFKVDGNLVKGVIRGVTQAGKLILEIDGSQCSFGMKEIVFKL
ncbi:biotin--[acetyl-CoA-carboxylase] ligase [Muriicola marianensis]|uniref:Biotin--[acetyl-CoA-carboxylase] ligase n=1 Tax=Muriicola marianensis TaxID=1324801 RepID=A0ABQ1QV12_9FLAO|nr:biotin--[acetyl-CoA-carboxylase] ligase [Muriicola marianensis]GGD44330.1 biotin--[acetyl-CoA-carboxylase] ligase [Muriicola marianensis]